jgi:hypothetical protein
MVRNSKSWDEILIRGEGYNTSGVKHTLGIANHEHEHHLAFIITCDINETVV